MFPLSTIRAAARRRGGASLLLGVLAVVAYGVPSLAEAMQYDRAAIAAGELWRVATCHLAHWSLDHLIWDVLALVLLGLLCEGRDRRAFAWCVGLSAAATPLGVWTLLPELPFYRGLSGIDSALFALLSVTTLRDSRSQHRFVWSAGCLVVLLAFVVKVAYEFTTGTSLFVDSTASDMVPVPLAHLVGAAIGALTGAVAILAPVENKGSTPAPVLKKQVAAPS